MSDEKTEQPTEKKLTDARRDGQVSRSTDLVELASLAAVTAVMLNASDTFGDALRKLMLISTHFIEGDRSLDSMFLGLYNAGKIAVGLILPCIAAPAIAALFASVLQVGFHVSTKAVAPNFQAIDPIAGTKRLFSLRSVIDCAKMIVTALFIFISMWQVIQWLFPLIVGSLYQPLLGLTKLMWEVLIKYFLVACGILLIIAAADIKLQRFLFIRQLKMSKDEIKRESKDQEGDPRLKGERRKIAREMTTTPPPPKVSSASVLVVNPTHYAVALRYAPAECPLPFIIAKGMDQDAAELRQAATLARIPIVGNPPVARALYRVDVNEPIPEELFEAVAAILRWIKSTENQDAA